MRKILPILTAIGSLGLTISMLFLVFFSGTIEENGAIWWILVFMVGAGIPGNLNYLLEKIK